LLGHFECCHRAHLKIGALESRHFRALPEQGRRRMGFDLHADVGGFDFCLERIQRLGEEIGGGRRGRKTNCDVCRASGAGQKKGHDDGKTGPVWQFVC
jgi:hypothetical protein